MVFYKFKNAEHIEQLDRPFGHEKKKYNMNYLYFSRNKTIIQ